MSDSADLSPEPPLLGIEFVFDMGIKKIEEQVKEIEALDLKISVIFGFLSTVLVALLAVVFTADRHFPRSSSETVAGVFFLLGVVFTGIGIHNAFEAFQVRPRYTAPTVFPWANDDPKRIKRELLDTLETAVAGNRQEIDRKRVLATRSGKNAYWGFLSFLGAIIFLGTKLWFPV